VSAGETIEIASSLDAHEIVRAAQESRADAVHPGYGFLAESSELAAAVQAAGLCWVGPPPAALRAGGDKTAAKEIALAAGVPVVPGGMPKEIGFPLLVKAAAGGGGRGMRICAPGATSTAAIEAAGREARTAFGDGRLLFERYLERPRHIEIPAARRQPRAPFSPSASASAPCSGGTRSSWRRRPRPRSTATFVSG